MIQVITTTKLLGKIYNGNIIWKNGIPFIPL
jgi:hypothetical protein